MSKLTIGDVAPDFTVSVTDSTTPQTPGESTVDSTATVATRPSKTIDAGSITPAQRAEIRASVTWPDYVGTVVVLGLVLGIYLYFSFWL